MLILAIETSCDETSAAIVRDDVILATVVSSQIKLHEEYGGVVPELATREHLRNLTPVVAETLAKAGVIAMDLTAVAATQGPGLPNALMIGFRAAEAMAWSLGVPFIGVNHHEAHLYSPWIESKAESKSDLPDREGHPSPRPSPLRGEREAGAIMDSDAQGLSRARFDLFQPNVSLIVSGGHTMLVDVKAELEHRVLGGTVDDAAGECFDKVAKLIGLPYPGGPQLDRLAAKGNPEAYKFPRPMLHEPHDDFSFSGLKTSVRYFLRDNPGVTASEAQVADLCASVQAAIVEVLVVKTLRATKRLGYRCVTASGGVTCNSGLRAKLTAECARRGLALRLAERQLCTDNAGMVGILAARKLARKGLSTDYDADILPADVLV
ncbi:MAG: O-sialoglycoprotein endopeptidase [Verrucomicrobia bacterium]|jgi:N6-L-threonylcarbamoyladenine synthase|nr:O-sialoglycoprotein endopeptidase [Verrucomicrobiota bacterium]